MDSEVLRLFECVQKSVQGPGPRGDSGDWSGKLPITGTDGVPTRSSRSS